MSGRTVRVATYSALCLALFLGGVSFRLLRSAPQPPALGFRPAVVELIDPVNEGDLATARFQLVNSSDEPVDVIDVKAGCACTGVKGADGRPFHGPARIAPQSALDLSADVVTAGRAGKQAVAIEADSQIGDRRVRCATRVQLVVRPGWRASPAEVRFDGTSPSSAMTEKAEIFDGLSDPGIRLKEVRVSAPKYVRAEIVESHESNLTSGAFAGIDGEPLLLKKRYDVLVTLTPSDTPSTDEYSTGLVTLVAVDPAVEQKSLVVRWRNKRPKARLEPASLTIAVPKDGAAAHRHLRYITEVRMNRGPRVRELPRFVDVTFGDSQGRSWPVDVVVHAAKVGKLPQNLNVEIATGVPEQPTVLLPITLLQSP